MLKNYTIYARNLYTVAATLVHLRIPFKFTPHHAYKDKEMRSPYGKSTIDIELDVEKKTISDILYEMQTKYGDTFEFEIISES